MCMFAQATTQQERFVLVAMMETVRESYMLKLTTVQSSLAKGRIAVLSSSRLRMHSFACVRWVGTFASGDRRTM